jgi:protein O-mannosyl-transferase
MSKAKLAKVIWKEKQLSGGTAQSPHVYRLLGLAGGTLLLYWPVVSYEFLDFDDPFYVTQNPYVLQGFTFEGIKWAFTSFEGLYHPVTWLSLMGDAHLFGAKPFAFHLTNVWLHIANVLLFYLLLNKLHVSPFWSFAGAGLFACHPVNTESVAWISERKGLLATGFFLAGACIVINYIKG